MQYIVALFSFRLYAVYGKSIPVMIGACGLILSRLSLDVWVWTPL